MNKQQDMKMRCRTFGGASFLIIALLGQGTVLDAVYTGFICLLVSPFFFWALQLSSNFENRHWSEISNPLEQSWSFYGDGLLLTPAIVVSTIVWHDHADRMPWCFHQLWWTLAAGIGGIVFGMVFRKADNPRYEWQSLQGPAKWYHDHVLIPVLAGALFARALPVLWVLWDGLAQVVLGLVVCWVILAIIDKLRSETYSIFSAYPSWLVTLYLRCRLDPLIQHPRWDEAAFCRVYI
jgi:hypothetical protein